eukprot:3424094-Rhodomonas_salina.1
MYQEGQGGDETRGGYRLPPTSLPSSYAMSGTDLAYAATLCYAMSGIDLAYAATLCFAMSGTELAYDATLCDVMCGTERGYGGTRGRAADGLLH